MNVDSEAGFDELECYESLDLLSEWEDPSTGTRLGYAGCNGGVANSDIKIEESVEESPVMQQASCEWEDPATGVSLGYECDNDSDFGDHLDALPRKTYEWEDPGTGAVLGYECDEDSDFGDHIHDGGDEA